MLFALGFVVFSGFFGAQLTWATTGERLVTLFGIELAVLVLLCFAAMAIAPLSGFFAPALLIFAAIILVANVVTATVIQLFRWMTRPLDQR